MKDKHLLHIIIAGIVFFILVSGFIGYDIGYSQADNRCMEKMELKETIEKVQTLQDEYSLETVEGYVSGLNTSKSNELDTIYLADIDSLDKNGIYLYYRIIFVGSGEDVTYLHFNFEADSIYRSDTIIN